VAVVAALENQSGRHAGAHGQIRRYREAVCLSANAVGAKVFPRPCHDFGGSFFFRSPS
jgi:hypothetical protein